MTVIIIVYGMYSVFLIPKESSPNIKLGIISITTIDIGVNPQDMDSLITQKIEQEIKDIQGIKKMTSSSSVGVSNVVLELNSDIDVTDFLVKVRDKVDKVNLPADVEKPTVFELSSENTKMFDLLIYAPSDKYSLNYLKDRASDLKKELNGKGTITNIDIAGGNEYEYQVLVDRQKLEQYGMNLSDITNAIRANNRNTPLGNHAIGSLTYDFRIEGEFRDLADILQMPLVVKQSKITLQDIATVVRKPKDETPRRY
jgi:multidrug efflux pump subunit AcrB